MKVEYGFGSLIFLFLCLSERRVSVWEIGAFESKMIVTKIKVMGCYEDNL